LEGRFWTTLVEEDNTQIGSQDPEEEEELVWIT
jgi:hypothetical protein